MIWVSVDTNGKGEKGRVCVFCNRKPLRVFDCGCVLWEPSRIGKKWNMASHADPEWFESTDAKFNKRAREIFRGIPFQLALWI